MCVTVAFASFDCTWCLKLTKVNQWNCCTWYRSSNVSVSHTYIFTLVGCPGILMVTQENLRHVLHFTLNFLKSIWWSDTIRDRLTNGRSSLALLLPPVRQPSTYAVALFKLVSAPGRCDVSQWALVFISVIINNKPPHLLQRQQSRLNRS